MAGKVHAPYVISRRHQVRVHPATMRRRGIEALERYIEAGLELEGETLATCLLARNIALEREVTLNDTDGVSKRGPGQS
jgi:hypothetical protein